MLDLLRRHWFKAFGAILVGAAGSGAWDLVVKPVCLFLGEVLLTLGTLGLESLRDDVYVEVARGFHEAPSIMLFTVVATGVACGAPTLLLLERRNEASRSTRSSAPTAGPGLSDRLKELDAELLNLREKIRRLRRIGVGSAIVLFALWAFLLARLVYVNNATVHFEQLMAIATPFLQEHALQEVRADFAAMTTRREYVEITSKLEALIRENRRTPPRFSVW